MLLSLNHQKMFCFLNKYVFVNVLARYRSLGPMGGRLYSLAQGLPMGPREAQGGPRKKSAKIEFLQLFAKFVK